MWYSWDTKFSRDWKGVQKGTLVPYSSRCLVRVGAACSRVALMLFPSDPVERPATPQNCLLSKLFVRGHYAWYNRRARARDPGIPGSRMHWHACTLQDPRDPAGSREASKRSNSIRVGEPRREEYWSYTISVLVPPNDPQNHFQLRLKMYMQVT
eukprot:SAG11_NODE_7128_length_1189_cov_1.227523_1_plen_154_part_00